MREKLCAMPCHSAQPATKLAKAMPTPSITAAPRSIARRRRRPTFCAAKRISSQRSRRDIPLPSVNGRYSPTRTSLASLIFMLR